MVSTRHHPRPFPPPDTPSKTDNPESTLTRSSRSTKRRLSSSTASPGPESPTAAVAKSPSTRTRARATPAGSWSHTPSHITLIWLLLSLPLVVWDIGYVFGRPHTFPGGWLHKPIYSPYALYYKTDLMYGQPAWDEGNGFTAAQTALNVLETAMYYGYLYIVWKYGAEQEDRRVTRGGSKAKKVEGRGAPSMKLVGWLGRARVVGGKAAGTASLLGLSASVMTLSKTVLYWLNEYYSGWKYTGHNEVFDLITLFIIPNGLWLVFPTYMIYAFGADILEGLAVASGAPVPKAIATKEE